MTHQVNPVGWFEIHVNDLDRAKAFYEAVFKHALHPLDIPDVEYEMLVFAGDPKYSGATGALIKHPAKGPSADGTLVYFACDDCAEQCERIIQHGGTVLQAKHAIGTHGFIAIASDTEGNIIGLHSFA